MHSCSHPTKSGSLLPNQENRLPYVPKWFKKNSERQGLSGAGLTCRLILLADFLVSQDLGFDHIMSCGFPYLGVFAPKRKLLHEPEPWSAIPSFCKLVRAHGRLLVCFLVGFDIPSGVSRRIHQGNYLEWSSNFCLEYLPR